jgi:hypothetical protein
MMSRRAQSRLAALGLALLWLLLATGQAAAETYFVDAGSPAATPDGLSWSTAFTNVQSALDVAASGDEVWVANGVYTPTLRTDPADGRSATFQLQNGVALYGGFAGGETTLEQRDWAVNVTVLSGDLDGNDITDSNGVVTATTNIVGSNAYHVVTGSGVTETARLDGFTLTAGLATGGLIAPCGPACGGGMYNAGGSPTLANLSFSANQTHGHGGGMYSANSISTLTNITFTANQADVHGGGLYNESGSPILTGVTFSANQSNFNGGGLYNLSSNATLTNVTFTANRVLSGGGGMANEDGNPTLTDVTFHNNRATLSEFGGGDGGGMYNSGGSPVLTDVTFSANQAGEHGGGLYNVSNSNPTLTNVTFTANRAQVLPSVGDLDGGGGMYNNFNSHPTLTNVTFNANRASNFNGGGLFNEDGNPTLTNVTFTSNTGAGFGGGMYNEDGNPTLTNVTFITNTAILLGGGLANVSGSSPILANITFTANQATFGGGLGNESSNPTLANVIFSANLAGDRGGGMYNVDSHPMLTDVIFTANQAIGGMIADGGGMANIDNSSPTLTNVAFIANRADIIGGGMVNDNNSNPTLTNVTFSQNQATQGGGLANLSSSNLLIQNSIFWGNIAPTGPSLHNDASAPTVRYSLVEGGLPPGAADGGNNLFDDPRFVRNVNCGTDGCGDQLNTDDVDESANDDYGDLRLLPDSPAIDVGDNAADLDSAGALTTTIADIATDLNGDPRLSAVLALPATVDLGAYEASNSPPSFTSSPVTAATEEIAYTYAITASDPNLSGSSGLTLTAPTKPSWLTLVDNGDGTGTLSGTPTQGEIGPHAVTLQVADAASATAVQSFTVTVTNSNDAPSFTSVPVTAATEDSPYTYAITTADVDASDTRTLTAPVKPSWLTFTDHGDGTGTLGGTPANADVGSHAVTLQVADAANITATQSFTITVANLNSPPSFTSTPVTAAVEDSPYTYAITTADVDDGDAHTLTTPIKPSWLTLVDNGDGTATLNGTPANGDVGPHAVTLQVADGANAIATQVFTVTVTNTNDAPAFTSTPVTTASVGESYSYIISTSDPDAGDTRILSATVKPNWLTLTDNGDGTGSLNGAPTNGDVGSHAVTLQVADADNATATQSFQLQVSQIHTPTGAISGQVFADANGNGSQEAGEPGVAGVTVTVSDEGVAAAGVSVEQETQTDAQGVYRFTEVPVGAYTLSFAPPAGYALPGAPSLQVTVQEGETTIVPGFGVAVVAQPDGPSSLRLPLVKQ